MSYTKQKGTAFETAIVKYFESCGFTTPRRVALSGAAGDKGDIWLGSSPTRPSIIIECKNYAKELPYKMVEDFIGEAHIEYANALGIERDRVNPYRALLIVKRINLGTADSWIIWKNDFGVTIRARLGDIVNESSFNLDSYTCEENRLDWLVCVLSNKQK